MTRMGLEGTDGSQKTRPEMLVAERNSANVEKSKGKEHIVEWIGVEENGYRAEQDMHIAAEVEEHCGIEEE